MAPPCFICGKPMPPLIAGYPTWWCESCEVTEERDLYLPRVGVISSCYYDEGELKFLDHGAGHYPSPA